MSNIRTLFNFSELIKLSLNSIYFRLSKKSLFAKIALEKHYLDAFSRSGFTIEKCDKKSWLVSGSINALLRKNTSDIEVFNQIIIENEFKEVLEKIDELNLTIESFIDCGANIGLVSINLCKVLQPRQVLAIEPDPNNFKQLQENISLNELKAITVRQEGVWHRKANLKIDNSFRDGQDWSLQLIEVESNEGATPCSTIPDFMAGMNLENIDFLKIDIEGSERFILDKKLTNVSFLENVKVITVEIHDEFNCREMIRNVLMEYDFDLYEIGELTLGINRNRIY